MSSVFEQSEDIKHNSNAGVLFWLHLVRLMYGGDNGSPKIPPLELYHSSQLWCVNCPSINVQRYLIVSQQGSTWLILARSGVGGEFWPKFSRDVAKLDGLKIVARSRVARLK